MSSTHQVQNQSLPLIDYNVFSTDRALTEHAQRLIPEALADLASFGERVGSAQVIEWGFLANENPPKLHTHDPSGNRINRVEFHPSYHQLMSLSMRHGLHSLPWEGQGSSAHPYVARAALFMLMAQIEAGHGCPISMTTSVIPSLRRQPSLSRSWEPRITRTYDPRQISASQKDGISFGMALTEKQGGSDVRSNSSVAERVSDGYLLTGHKWFCSAPMSDAFMVLAQAPSGLSCFLLPRHLPDGSQNAIHLMRLKDKLGNRSNASSEIEFDRAWAQIVGEEGEGVRVIVEMINHTRLDCVIGSTGLMRQSVAQAINHTASRSAFGRALDQQPLMQQVLADLALESEASTALMIRTALAFDRGEDLLARLLTPIAKYLVTKRTPAVAYEALECLGGNGYVEESLMPRLFRESPVNAVWEGSGNVIVLDVLRVLRKQPASIQAFIDELTEAGGVSRSLDHAVEQLSTIARGNVEEAEGRRLVELLGVVMQGSLLIRTAPSEVAEAFIASRIDRDWGTMFGTLPPGSKVTEIVDRARPQFS